MTGCCRDCNIAYKHCHNPEYSCKFLKSSLFKGLSSKIQKALSFIPVKINAFSDICFGNDVQKYNKWATILEKMISIGEWLSLEEYSKDDLKCKHRCSIENGHNYF